MSKQFKEYDADRISVILGPYTATTQGGLSDGSFVTIKFLSPVYMSKVGVDGTVTRSRTNDRRFTCTLTVMQSSEINLALCGFVQADLGQNNGLNATTFSLLDLSGNTLLNSQYSWVAELPESDFDRDAGTRKYVIEGSWVGPFCLGGN
jgi:hypothetical protein